jgi:Flp pilus assembly protein TadD
MLPTIVDGQLKKQCAISFVIVILIVLAFASYWRVQHYNFLAYDDQLYVTENYQIQSGINWKLVIDSFEDTRTGHWHPLTMLSHALDWQIYGGNAGGHHRTNIIIHVINTILLFFLLNIMTGAIWKSALVAALFTIHPINVESVAWIAERKNVLSTFFWILTMLFYVWYARQPSWKRYLPVFFCFAMGLMSKPMLVTLPFALLLIDYWPLDRTTLRNKHNKNTTPFLYRKEKIFFLIAEKVPMFCLTVASMIMTVYVAQSARAIYRYDTMSLSKSFGNILVSYSVYIKKLFWPVDLSVFYPYGSLLWWHVLLASILLVTISILSFKQIRKYPYLFVGWFWYLGTLIPVIGLVRVGSQSMADRYAYVPFIGLFVIIAWLIPDILSNLRQSKAFTFLIFITLITIFTALTIFRIEVWKDTKALFEAALKVNPDNFIALNVLGSQELYNGNLEKALNYYQASIRISPKYPRTYCHAGNVYFKLGKFEEARNYYEKAIAIDEDYANAHYNLGVLNLATNRYQEAIVNFNKALAIQSHEFKSHLNLGIALLQTGDVRDAIIHFERALELNPGSLEARKGLRISCEMLKKN